MQSEGQAWQHPRLRGTVEKDPLFPKPGLGDEHMGIFCCAAASPKIFRILTRSEFEAQQRGNAKGADQWSPPQNIAAGAQADLGGGNQQLKILTVQELPTLTLAKMSEECSPE